MQPKIKRNLKFYNLKKCLLQPNCSFVYDLSFLSSCFKSLLSLVFWSFTTISFFYIINFLLSNGSFQTAYKHAVLSHILNNKTKDILLLTLFPQSTAQLLPTAIKLSKIAIYVVYLQFLSSHPLSIHSNQTFFSHYSTKTALIRLPVISSHF